MGNVHPKVSFKNVQFAKSSLTIKLFMPTVEVNRNTYEVVLL